MKYELIDLLSQGGANAVLLPIMFTSYQNVTIEHVLCYRMLQQNVSLLKNVVVNIVFFYFIFRVTTSGSYKVNLETFASAIILPTAFELKFERCAFIRLLLNFFDLPSYRSKSRKRFTLRLLCC